eukprot:400056-Prorocentrum_lima.AAC.1
MTSSLVGSEMCIRDRPLPTQSSMSPSDMPPGGAVPKVTVRPGYFHSQNKSSSGQFPQPPLSASATSSSSGPT